jgi:AraC family transcriptional regulator
MSSVARTVARRDLAGLVFSSLVYEPGATLGWHTHPLAYLSFVGGGSYTERLDRRTRHCGASTLLLHAAGERHSNVFHDQPVRLLRVEASDSQLLELPGAQVHSEGYGGESSRNLCRRMLHELDAPDDVTPLALHGLLLELVAGLARASAPSGSREPSWLERVEDFLQAGFDAPLSLAAIAAHAGVHPVHLARTYRRHRCRTIGDRIRELRIEHACRLLATTRDSVADIASRCGFSDQSHLARLMRARLGRTPTQYRAERASR